jgi:IS4 transposase
MNFIDTFIKWFAPDSFRRLARQTLWLKRQGKIDAFEFLLSRRQGRVPTQEALELAGWLILITNAPEVKLPSAVLAYLYRLRWQVELIFKQCKDTLRLDQSRSDNPWRAQCEIWARLLAAVFNAGA